MNEEDFNNLLAEILQQFAIPSGEEVERFIQKIKGGDRPL